MPTISITTDFGSKDGFVGTLKGVIWSICPGAQIADISHNISPQNILEGAFALWRAYSFFPSGAVHIAVVDPGVGTKRRPIAARIGGHTFVGPDNGIFTPMFEDAEKYGLTMEIVHLAMEKFWLHNVSHTFHGRDIFAPVAAHIANGVPLSDLGPALHDPVRISMPKPVKTAKGWRAHITVVDIYGNCTTDLPADAVARSRNVTFLVGGHEVHGLVQSYGNKRPGDLVALVDSEDCVEIAVVNGSAAKKLGVKIGDVVEVTLKSKAE